jgi:hypothetical protein
MTAMQQPWEMRPDAVVWVDERHAIVARAATDGAISTVEVRRVGRPETRYLAQVVHEIGNREHVMIIGPSVLKLALEREYVALSHRPERLVPAPQGASGAGSEILHRMERLAA